MLSNERAAFEAWCFANGLMAESHGVRSECRSCDVAWLAWQAATAVAEAAVKDAGGGEEPVAYCTPDGERCVTARTMNSARRDGGAMLSSMASFTVPAFALPQTSDAVPDGYRLESDGGCCLTSYAEDGSTCTINLNGQEIYFDRNDHVTALAASQSEVE